MSTFINPYNFISLGSENIQRNNFDIISKRSNKGSKDNPLVTGVIHYTVTTITPIFIPNITNDNAFYIDEISKDDKHKKFDFFSYTQLNSEEDYSKKYQEPVIPGSEIRGVIRSVFEAETNSCISAVNDGEILSKRTPELYKAGILEKEKSGEKIIYTLFEADDCIYREGEKGDYKKAYDSDVLKDYKDGQKVYVKYHSRANSNGKRQIKGYIDEFVKEGSGTEGYLMKGESGPKKHNAHVFIKKEKIMKKLSEQDAVFKMDAILREYKLNNENAYSQYAETWEKVKKGEICTIPVYYSIVNSDLVYLSPACITREIYVKQVKDILESRKACDDKNKLCPACSLFGTVNDKLKIASKVRFSDLSLIKEENKELDYYYEDIITLPELSEPSLTATEMYLQKPHADGKVLNWTYDYYTMLSDSGEISVVSYVPQLSGRKFYWSDKKTYGQWRKKYKDNKISRTERNKTVRPVKSDVSFQGELYFDNITENQLKQLIFVLNIAAYNKDNKEYAYKLGSGKPVGLGSISIKVDQIYIRKLKENKDHCIYELTPFVIKQEEYDSYKSNHMTQLNMFEVKNFEQDYIHYPNSSLDDDDEGFNWFVNNRWIYNNKEKKCSQKGMKNSRTQDVYHEYLVTGCEKMENNYVIDKKNNSIQIENAIYSKYLNKIIDVKIIKLLQNNRADVIVSDDKNIKGMIFDLPKEYKVGDIVKMKVTKAEQKLKGGYSN